jgi:hypothetical protein
MTDKPKGKIFIKLPLELLTSRAWQALGINARRFIDFLMIEHMRHGGRENGLLLAPRRQLEEFGIGQHFVSGAIEEAESLGFVDCKRGVGRRPSSYALSWLSLADDTPPSNRFLQCDAAAEAISTTRKAAKQRKLRETAPVVTAKQQPAQMTAVCAENDCQTAVTKPIATAKQQSQSPKTSTAKQQHLSRISYQEEDLYQEEEGEVGMEEALSDTCRWHVTNGRGFTVCGKRTEPGTDRCAEHGVDGAIH